MGFTSKLPDTQLLLSPYSILLFIYSYEHSSAQRPQMSNISLGKEKKNNCKNVARERFGSASRPSPCGCPLHQGWEVTHEETPVLLCPLTFTAWFLIHSIGLNFHFKRVLTSKLVLQDYFFLSLFLF